MKNSNSAPRKTMYLLATCAVFAFTGAGCSTANDTNITQNSQSNLNTLNAEPLVDASPQQVVSSTVMIDRIVATEPSWIVIRDNTNDSRGNILGYASAPQGESTNVVVNIAKLEVTPTQLIALLHEDKGTVGVYEFPGVDVPTLLDEKDVAASFDILPAESITNNVNSNNGNGVKVFTVTETNFSFSPNVIRVKQGDQVKITLNSLEGFHNFSIDSYNVSSNNIGAGQTVSIEFTADKKGTFEFYCNVDSHKDKGMTGSLIVE
jgi:nitrosocyanin